MTSSQLYLRLLRYVAPYKGMFALSIIGTVLLAASEPAIPALMKPLLDGSFVEKDPENVLLMPVLLLAIVLFRGFAGFVGATAMRWVSNRVVTDLRDLMFNRVLELPASHFDHQSSGQTLSKLIYDVTRVMSASTDVLVVVLRDSLAVVGLLAWMFYLNWQLSLICLVIVPPVALIINFISRRLRMLSRRLQGLMGGMTDVIQEGTRGHRVVKIFGGEAYERGRFAKANDRVRQFNVKIAVASEMYTPAIQFLAAAALAVVVYVSSSMAQRGELSVGEFVSLFTAMGMLFTPIKRLTKMNEKLQVGLAAAESIFGLIDETPETDSGTRRLPRAAGGIVFDRVGLCYGEAGPLVLDDFSLEIAPGERVALVGRSGSGKSSIVNLLPRFYAPTAGRITLDGIDIRDLKLADLRANIAYVSQDTVLFNDTVRANIAYAAGIDADPERLREAARQAHALTFIEELPDGMDTLIGENGVLLSGGQRQRIAIARALYKDAPILILDEATASLDSESEREIQLALERLENGRTSLIIAHRFSTIESCDRILVLQDGRLVESGSHRELLAVGGVYAGLHALQDLSPTPA